MAAQTTPPRHLHIEHHAPVDLKPDDSNPRAHSKRQIAKLKRGIARHGFLVPIIIDQDRRIIAGHARREVALDLGLPTVPCVDASHLTELERREFLLCENRVSDDATWSVPKLETFLKGMLEIAPDCSFENTGFEIAQIELLLEPRSKKANRGSGIEMSLKVETLPPVSRPGDVFRLGPHVLVCGDARNAGLVTAALQGEQAQMAIADPAAAIADTPAWLGLLAIQRKATCEGAIHVVFADWRQSAALHGALSQSDYELVDLCVWTGAPGLSQGLYPPAHLLGFILKSGSGSPINNVRRRGSRTNVWPDLSEETLAIESQRRPVKPVGLLANVIRDFSRRNGLIFDPYCGSGATLWAARETGRRAALLETNPVLVDATLRRWRALTQDDPTLDGPGLPFSVIERDRAATAHIGSVEWSTHDGR